MSCTRRRFQVCRAPRTDLRSREVRLFTANLHNVCNKVGMQYPSQVCLARCTRISNSLSFLGLILEEGGGGGALRCQQTSQFPKCTFWHVKTKPGNTLDTIQGQTRTLRRKGSQRKKWGSQSKQNRTMNKNKGSNTMSQSLVWHNAQIIEMIARLAQHGKPLNKS